MTTREDILSLAPCPFCGGWAIKSFHIRDGRALGCADCGASIREFHGPTDIDKRLAAAWNRRAAPTPPAAEAPGQEPVAWQRYAEGFGWVTANPEDLEHYRSKGRPVRPLYLAPPTYADAEAKVKAAIYEGLLASKPINIIHDGEECIAFPTGELTSFTRAAIRSLASPAPKGET